MGGGKWDPRPQSFSVIRCGFSVAKSDGSADVARSATSRAIASSAAVPRFGLSPEDADAVIGEMKQIVNAEWRKTVRAAGGSDADVGAVERAFAYEGFEYSTGG